MNNFKIYNTDKVYTNYCPTRILFYENSRFFVNQLIENTNFLIIVDKNFIDLDIVKNLRNNRNCIDFFSISEEPKLENFKKIDNDKIKKCKIAIAIGGGATIDFAKLLIVKLNTNNFESTLNENKSLNFNLDLITLPTTCGSGSETSRYCVIFDNNNAKHSYRHWDLTPKITILDPYFIINSPTQLVLNSTFDTFLHTFEPFFLQFECEDEKRKNIILQCKNILTSLNNFINNKNDINSIKYLMISSANGGMSISNYRTGLVHTFGESYVKFNKISHVESLYKFFNAISAYYKDYFNKKIKKLSLESYLEYDYIINFWNNNLIHQEYSIDEEDKTELVNQILKDIVIFKELPFKLTEDNINEIIIKTFQNDR